MTAPQMHCVNNLRSSPVHPMRAGLYIRCALCVRLGNRSLPKIMPRRLASPPRCPSLVASVATITIRYVAVARLPRRSSPAPFSCKLHFPRSPRSVLCALRRLQYVCKARLKFSVVIVQLNRVLTDYVVCVSAGERILQFPGRIQGHLRIISGFIKTSP